MTTIIEFCKLKMILQDCGKLESIQIPNNIKIIEESTFRGCIELKNIRIPDSVTTIGEGAFAGCNELTSIEIPSSVTNIGKMAFSSCINLKKIYIPSSVVTIGRYARGGGILAPFCSKDLIIYTEFGEDEIPSGWASGWDDRDWNDRIEIIDVVYNCSLEEFINLT